MRAGIFDLYYYTRKLIVFNLPCAFEDGPGMGGL